MILKRYKVERPGFLLQEAGYIYSFELIKLTMLLPVEVLSIIVIILFIYLPKKRSKHFKRQQIKLALLYWFLFQISFLSIALFIFLLFPLRGDQAITYSSAILWTTVVLSVIVGLWYSGKVLKKRMVE